MSAAIFAPGWVYETEQPPDFQTAQNRWWDLVEKSWGISQNYPKVLPFYANFDQGHSYHFSIDGSQVSSAPWNNISSQSFQPFLEYPGDPSSNTIQVSVNFKEASYSGGGNITFRGSLEGDAYFTTRLFQGELILGNLPLQFIYSVKSDGSSMVGLSLEFSSSMLEKKSVLLASWGNTLLTMNRFSSKFSNVIMPRQAEKLDTAPEWVIQESSIAMNGYTLTGIHAVCYKSEPDIYKQELKSDSLSPDPSEYYAVLGHIEVKTSVWNLDFPPSAAWLVEGQYIKWALNSQGSKTLSVKIIWSLKGGNASWFPKYNIYVEKQPNIPVDEKQEYIGVAEVETFYVSDLVVPFGFSSLRFIVQICSLDGTSQKLDDSPSFLLSVEG